MILALPGLTFAQALNLTAFFDKQGRQQYNFGKSNPHC